MRREDPSSRKVEGIVFHVRVMEEEDFRFAIDLTSRMGWGLSAQDFEFMRELEPEGCFVLQEDSELIGLATTVSFGEIAWFGNLVVSEDRRRKGAGSLLATHALKYLKDKDVKTVGLYAYIERIAFYQRLGFKSDNKFIVLRGKNFALNPKTRLRQFESKDLANIVDFDLICFGASRRKLLEPILLDPDNLCYMATDGDELTGYIVAKIFKGMAEIGPLVCRAQKQTIAIDLLQSALSRLKDKETTVFVPEEENFIVNILKEAGFKESFCVQRMFYGPMLANERTPDCIYLAESLERG